MGRLTTLDPSRPSLLDTVRLPSPDTLIDSLLLFQWITSFCGIVTTRAEVAEGTLT